MRRDYLYTGLGVGALFAGLIATLSGRNKTVSTSSFPPASTFRGTTSLTAYLSDTFFVALNDMVSRFREKGATVTGDDMLMMFLAESGCRADIANSIGCAGLNQICNLRGVGFTEGVQAYIALPADKQLVFVERYFNNVNRYPQMRDVGSLYLANFSPAFLGKPDDFIMYRKDVDKAYALNRGVDFGNKGFIEVADMPKFMRSSAVRNQSKFDELRGRLASVTANA